MPLISVIPVPGTPEPDSTKITSPDALTESDFPLGVVVGEAEVN